MTKVAVFCLAAGMASAQTVSLTVNTGTALERRDSEPVTVEFPRSALLANAITR
jgi:hypothetical protein